MAAYTLFAEQLIKENMRDMGTAEFIHHAAYGITGMYFHLHPELTKEMVYGILMPTRYIVSIKMIALCLGSSEDDTRQYFANAGVSIAKGCMKAQSIIPFDKSLPIIVLHYKHARMIINALSLL